ncbi:MAG: type II toxin-antitoxin system mRNA interferase toxin, RelE/StbE family [Candidatus Aminicenantes bacterium]|nr:type II toxin-antitoxin system mRNA interferase toxin, RelE/StbE family [Candidatus Aminicenantes bacterium]
MKKYRLAFSRQAKKDIEKLTPKLKEKAKQVCRSLAENPYIGKALVGELKGFYSLRLTYKDRIVYSINNEMVQVFIIRVRTHYGD